MRSKLLLIAIVACPVLLWGQAAAEYGLGSTTSGLTTSKTGSAVGRSLNKAFTRVERALSGQKAGTVSTTTPVVAPRRTKQAAPTAATPAKSSNVTNNPQAPNIQAPDGISIAGAEQVSTSVVAKRKYKRNVEIKFDQ